MMFAGMTGQSYETGRKVRFGTFEADVRTGELRKSGVRIKIQSQPFKLLIVLLEDERPIYRVAVQDRRIELVTDFKGLEPADIVVYWGITADNELVVSLRFFTADVYAIEWDRP